MQEMFSRNPEKEEYPEIPSNRGDDLHNIEVVDQADLILFMAGNQFMVMDDLIRAFQKKHPEVERIFYETLPPGLELRQILAGGALFRGRVITGRPDVYTSVTTETMEELRERGLVEDFHVYLHNRIVLMVPEGNPGRIGGVQDLGRDEIRISQPGAMEDITRYILMMYEQAGGKKLVKRIMEGKRAEGTTILTIVHHRETPLRLRKGTVDVGPVWATEYVHARSMGLPVEKVEPGEGLDQRDKVNYCVAAMKDAPNRANARKFVDFLLSDEAQGIYSRYGFVTVS